MLFSRTNADATQRRYSGAVEAIRTQLKALGRFDEPRLRELTDSLRKESRTRDRPGDFEARAVALICESVRRAHSMVPYDCQLMAGLALADGMLAEMATGEGKTLVALLPAFVFALHGKGAHVATVNPYLAERDCEFARPAFEMLGISIALLNERVPPAEKRAAYRADVTYGVGTLLRWSMKRTAFSSTKRAARSSSAWARRDLARSRGHTGSRIGSRASWRQESIFPRKRREPVSR